MRRRWVFGILLGVMLVLGVGGAALAQDATPTTPDTTQVAPKRPLLGRMFGMRGGDWGSFDTLAGALKLTPTALFEQLHSGKTLAEIAEAQGVDLTTVQADLQAARVQAMKDKIAAAVVDGTMTQEQADWMLKGIESGWMGGGRGMRGWHGMLGGRGGCGMFGGQPVDPSNQQQRFQAPSGGSDVQS